MSPKNFGSTVRNGLAHSSENASVIIGLLQQYDQTLSIWIVAILHKDCVDFKFEGGVLEFVEFLDEKEKSYKIKMETIYLKNQFILKEKKIILK